MTTFQDGPAQGKTLMLKRSPQFLRVVKSGREWDALDQIDDKPADSEELFAYERVGAPTACHIRATRGGGFYSCGIYKLIFGQPGDAIMRDLEKWRQWCINTVRSRE